MKSIYKKIIFSLVLGIVLGLSLSLIPRHWQISPECCDMPNAGTNWGLPFVVRSESCCGIGGPAIIFKDYHPLNYLLNVIIYSVVIFGVIYFIRKRKSDV